jgi:hypothetical protein
MQGISSKSTITIWICAALALRYSNSKFMKCILSFTVNRQIIAWHQHCQQHKFDCLPGINKSIRPGMVYLIFQARSSYWYSHYNWFLGALLARFAWDDSICDEAIMQTQTWQCL